MTNDGERTPGQWLRAARERAGFSVAARFAEELDIAPSVLSTYERDKVKVPDDLSEQIARALRRDIIEVRAGLGLWVPPAEGERAEFSLDDIPTEDLMHYLEQRMRDEREGRQQRQGRARRAG